LKQTQNDNNLTHVDNKYERLYFTCSARTFIQSQYLKALAASLRACELAFAMSGKEALQYLL
jgi:hypothetical protein